MQAGVSIHNQLGLKVLNPADCVVFVGENTAVGGSHLCHMQIIKIHVGYYFTRKEQQCVQLIFQW